MNKKFLKLKVRLYKAHEYDNYVRALKEIEELDPEDEWKASTISVKAPSHHIGDLYLSDSVEVISIMDAFGLESEHADTAIITLKGGDEYHVVGSAEEIHNLIQQF